MKRKECSRQEEIIHRMQIYVAQCGDDEHQEEKEKQRHGGEVADLTRQRTRLQLLRHGHPNLESRNQIRVAPRQVPPLRSFVLAGGRERVVGKVNIFEVRVHGEIEILHLRHAISQLVSPVVQTL